MIKRGKTQAEDTIERLEAQIKKIKGLQAELNELTSGLVTPEVVLKGAAITKRREFWERDRVKKIAGRHRYKDSQSPPIRIGKSPGR